MIEFHSKVKGKLRRYRANQQIKITKVRLISEKGENLGIVETSEALKRAIEKDLDLVEIAPKANPPVCKIVDLKKFLYLQKQKEKEAQKKTHKVETKEFRFGPNIAEHDLETKIERAKEFLRGKNKVRVTVVYKGREKAHPEIGKDKINRFIKALENISKIEGPPQLRGSFLSVLISPNYAKTENKKDNS